MTTLPNDSTVNSKSNQGHRIHLYSDDEAKSSWTRMREVMEDLADYQQEAESLLLFKTKGWTKKMKTIILEAFNLGVEYQKLSRNVEVIMPSEEENVTDSSHPKETT